MQNNQVRKDGFARISDKPKPQSNKNCKNRRSAKNADQQKTQSNNNSKNRKKQGQQSSYDEIRGKIKTECEE